MKKPATAMLLLQVDISHPDYSVNDFGGPYGAAA